MNAHVSIPSTIDKLEDELERKAMDAVEGRPVEGRVKDDRPRKSDRFPSGRAA